MLAIKKKKRIENINPTVDVVGAIGLSVPPSEIFI